MGSSGINWRAANQQLDREKQFDSSLNRGNLQAWMERLSAKPHHLGSAADKENAEFIAGLFRSWGYDTTIETFYPLFPTPRLRRVEMTGPRRFVAKLEEPAIAEDKTSGLREDQLPVYNAFSIDGDVTAALVYVNYGLPADYEVLAERQVFPCPAVVPPGFSIFGLKRSEPAFGQTVAPRAGNLSKSPITPGSTRSTSDCRSLCAEAARPRWFSR